MKVELEWNYLPELPKVDKWVLVSIKMDNNNVATMVMAHQLSRHKKFYPYGYPNPEERVYAWAYWPEAAPIKKLVWECRTSMIDWHPISDEEHELIQHLARFEFRQVEK